MKTDSSIKNITVAAIKRSSIDLELWTRTKLIDEFPFDINSVLNELPVVFLFIDSSNWTLITTQRILGSIDSTRREITFEDLDGTTWGLFKNQKADKNLFRTMDIYGEQKDFYMETGYASMGILQAVRTIENFYKTN